MKLSKKTLNDLGFYQVLTIIEKYLLFEDSKTILYNRDFINNKNELELQQKKIQEILFLLSNPDSIKVNNFPSLTNIFIKLKNIYQNVDGQELYEVGMFIDSSQVLYDFITQPLFNNKKSEIISSLLGDGISQELIDFRNEVFYALDESGKVKESHPLIKALVKRVENAKRERNNFTKDFIKDNKLFLQSDLETIRDERIVIPVRTDAKSKIKGFVHGSSSTGSTVFVEPYKLVEYNNSVVLAEQQIQIEIAKIYNALNKKLREILQYLKELKKKISEVDILYCFSRWVIKYNCSKVELDKDDIKLLFAKHPLLADKAVPISLEIEKDIKCVVISGPNAGGKTVTIKTVGLFSALNQFIGYIPAQEGSSLPLFDKIYTDIGDEQSIEEELSTFSGHMNSLSKILKNSSANTLVILDELGSATDPNEGGAIAQSIVDFLNENCKVSFITSHLDSLKHKAYISSNMLNASMEFDENSHMPTFRVVCGLPGDSHAIDTAIRMKLPQKVITNAKKYLGDDQLQIGQIVKRLERERQDIEKKALELKKKESELDYLKKEVELYRKKIKEKEFNLKAEQATELSRYISKSRKDLENLVNKIVTGDLTKDKTKAVKDFIVNLDKKEEEIKKQIEEEELLYKEKKEPFDIKEGMNILCGDSKREGVVLKADGKKKWVVQVGSLKISFKEKDLYKAKDSLVTKKVSVSYNNETPRPKATIDVRGLTLERAIEEVQKQLEACLIHNFNSFSIIHGFGDGILQKGLHHFLKAQSQVKDYNFALPPDGGMGKTYVML